ncbi:MAG TPA: phosphoenolpyruvate synthase, partial [Dehalococcoidia bacterium]|nr:phosphoenolpyruvate synthase [Dehalococcoidia bacterium]
VPPAFIVTTRAYFRFMEAAGLRPRLQTALAAVDIDNSSQLQKAAAAIKAAIRGAPMPADIAAAIVEAYRQLGGGPVAVRSSASAEDLPEASFAGQQDAFLNVEGEEAVVAAVQACWASLFEARAVFYRSQQGLDHFQVGIAVPVQRMVQAERSGVLFTLEPVTNDRKKVVIEAISGLGEAVVSGVVTPDYYVVDKEAVLGGHELEKGRLAILEKRIAMQERKLVRNSSGKGNMWVDLKPEESSSQKLTDAQVLEIARLGCRVEEHYAFPQDIEWAWQGGSFYILQARPVTTVREFPAIRAEAAACPEDLPAILSGSPASPGVEAGPVRIIFSPAEIDKVRPGDVLVTEMTAPDWVPAMKRSAAIITNQGGRTCHAAIVSRELGIPSVVGTGNATTTLRDGQIVTVDGSSGCVYAGRVDSRLAWWADEKDRRARIAHVQTRTRLYVNLADPELAEVVARRNVDGVGLLRAEFIIANHIGEHPRLAIDEGRSEEFTQKLAQGLEQFARAFYPRPVVFRTTDFKSNEYARLKGGERYEEHEENPMIGYRGASRYIRDIDVFRLEIEAIKQVRQRYTNLWVMIPFVRTPEEMAGVKAILEREGLRRSEEFKLWMMAEIPSNVFLLDQFCDVGIDGISIGSNDLTQLTLGIDRDNARFAKEFDERNPAVMIALEQLIKTGKRRGITCSICGQAPSDYPEFTQKLVEWGITSISVNPDVIEKTREIIAQAEARLAQPATA